MKFVIWILVPLLILLHQADPYRSDGKLLLGVLPVSLMYHVCISLAAGLTWYLATRFAWPADLEVTTTHRDDPTDA